MLDFPNHFLLSLAVAISDLTSLQIPSQLAIQDARIDGGAVITVMRMYAAPAQAAFVGTKRVYRAAIQFDTRGGGDGQTVLAQAWKVHEGLLVNSAPRSGWLVPGKQFATEITEDAEGDWLIRLIQFVNAPGILGRDEKERWIATFNVDVAWERVVR